MSDPGDALSEAAKLGILQGRFEALEQRSPIVEPIHLILGVLKTLDETALATLGISSRGLADFCGQAGSSVEPAVLSPGDIDYSPACHALVATAIEKAGPAAQAAGVEPLHLLLASHAPDAAVAPLLQRLGATPERIAEAIAAQG